MYECSCVGKGGVKGELLLLTALLHFLKWLLSSFLFVGLFKFSECVHHEMEIYRALPIKLSASIPFFHLSTKWCLLLDTGFVFYWNQNIFVTTRNDGDLQDNLYHICTSRSAFSVVITGTCLKLCEMLLALLTLWCWGVSVIDNSKPLPLIGFGHPFLCWRWCLCLVPLSSSSRQHSIKAASSYWLSPSLGP